MAIMIRLISKPGLHSLFQSFTRRGGYLSFSNLALRLHMKAAGYVQVMRLRAVGHTGDEATAWHIAAILIFLLFLRLATIV
jgi:hypothetical protein